MCDVGGPRCELADELNKFRMKLRRSPSFKEDPYPRKRMKVEELMFLNSKKSLVQSHSKDREKWQVDSKPLTRRKAQELRKEFPKLKTKSEVSARDHLRTMYEEYESMLGTLSDAEENVVQYYTIAGYLPINQRLRNKYQKKFEWSDLASIDEKVEILDSILKKRGKSEEPRVLYRHHLVPGGWEPREYAEKYFPVGSEIQDPAYLSTTEDLGYIAGHLTKREPSKYLVYQILSSSGISLVEKSEEEVGNVQSFERERLLPRGSKFRVVGYKKEKLELPLDRETLIKQFVPWEKDPKDRFVTVVMLLDESDSY